MCSFSRSLLLSAPFVLATLVPPALSQTRAPRTPQVLDWPRIFDPTEVLHLNLSMTQADWNTIQNDQSFDIEVPALFWMGSETPLLVSVRHKSSDPLNSGSGFTKVSLKVDVNEYVKGQEWHGLKKLSLENGDDEDVVTEGVAWGLHRLAIDSAGYHYPVGLANWATLVINGTYTGVYVNAEQIDKTFLKNRGLWDSGSTWLYDLDDVYSDNKKQGDGDSPTYQLLCYDPFQKPSAGCPTPDANALTADLHNLINMQGMLTMGAVNSFLSHPDALFSKGKNCAFADFMGVPKRLYYPWDLDSVMNKLNWDIFNPGDHYSDAILGLTPYRDQYKSILGTLLTDALHEDQVHSYIDAVEPLLTPWLEIDPNNQIGTGNAIPQHFQKIRDWIVLRKANVLAQIAND
jgi:hypothetical protein